MRVLVASLVVGGLILAAPAVAQEDLFHDGNRLYQEGDYAGALERYLRITDAGFESGELYYNLGNTYFKLGELGRAILSYERAARLIPGDENLRANLDLARSMTADDIIPLPGFWLLRAWRWWVDLLPEGLLLVLVSASYLLACAATALLILRTRWRRAWVARGAITFGALVLVLGTVLLIRELGVGRPVEAVVLAAEVQVQSAPAGDPELLLFSIHEGTVVRVDRRSESWAEVVLADGKVGWVPLETLGTI